MSKARVPEVIRMQANDVSILELAKRRGAEMKRSGSEYCGPCLKCEAAKDGFHIYQNRSHQWKWLCYSCHSGESDTIGFLRWHDGMGFVEAIEYLCPNYTVLKEETHGHEAQRRRKPSTPSYPSPAKSAYKPAKSAYKPAKSAYKPAIKKPKRSDTWSADIRMKAYQSHQSLIFGDDAVTVRNYLDIERRLEPATWIAYGLGATHDYYGGGVEGKGWMLTMPWYKGCRYEVDSDLFLNPKLFTAPDGSLVPDMLGGELCGIRYRYIEKQGKSKQRSFGGDKFDGLFGWQAGVYPSKGRTLILCEGEINAMSLWQVLRWTGVDVLSIGSQSARLTTPVMNELRKYGTIMVWMDEWEYGADTALKLKGWHTNSDKEGGDANDLLVNEWNANKPSELQAVIARARLEACETGNDRRRLADWLSKDKMRNLSEVERSIINDTSY